jgi:hypothetical protein
MTYVLGALPSPPDQRDYPVSSFNPTTSPALAPAWSFMDLLQPPRNQGNEGTCVGHAVACVMGYQQDTTAPTVGGQPDREVLSPRDVYEGARMLEPTPGGAEGAYPRAAWKYAQRQGVCREDLWPYRAHERGEPRAGAAESRYANRVATYSRVPIGTKAIKEAMYWHGPAQIVIPVDDGFATPDADGRIVSAGQGYGAHAIVIAGWDDNRKAWHVRNSWGAEWGQNGSAWLPYSWALLEAWVATPAVGTPPPEVPWWERLFPFWRFE